MKTLTNIQMSLKAVPESMFWLTDVFWKNTSGFQEAVCVLQIGVLKATSKGYWQVSVTKRDCENTFSLISVSPKGFSNS